MDLKLIGALALLLVWAVAALVLEGPGWVHLLLTVGVSLLIYAIVARTADEPTAPAKPTTPGDAPRR